MESLFTFLSNLVLFLTLTTLLFAFGACTALVLRRRMPARTRRERDVESDAPLLRRYIPQDME